MSAKRVLWDVRLVLYSFIFTLVSVVNTLFYKQHAVFFGPMKTSTYCMHAYEIYSPALQQNSEYRDEVGLRQAEFCSIPSKRN